MAWTLLKRSDRFVMLADGLVMVTTSAQLVSRLSNGVNVTIQAEFDPELRRVVATSVQAAREEEGAEVTTTLLQEIRVQEAIVTASMNWMVGVVGGGGRILPAIEALDLYQPTRGRPRVEQVSDAAAIYVVATVVNLPPLKTVADVLSVSQSTATRLIAEAREGRTLEQLEVVTRNPLTTDDMRAFLARPRTLGDG